MDTDKPKSPKSKPAHLDSVQLQSNNSNQIADNLNIEKRDGTSRCAGKVAEREEKTLAFWEEEKIFEKSLKQTEGGKEFVFYDGPPFANGLPHYGHILASLLKDVIPRYKTMQGFHVPRRWGWDCHGLPVENLVEKELGLSSKKDIENYGMDKFNQASAESVMRYADNWRAIVPRLGRFVDMKADYRTMDTTYTESVWWSFKTLYDKGLIYEGFKSMHLCPHCETTLSNFEVTQGYKDTTDISVYVKFEIRNPKSETNSKFKAQNLKTYLLAWTTTPWTLPGNVALAINPETIYVRFKIQDSRFMNEEFILAKERAEAVLKTYKYEILGEMKGDELIGLEYEPLFNYYVDFAKAKTSSGSMGHEKELEKWKNGWKIYGADFVTTEDGTGVVHIAPAFGEDDYQLSLKFNLPFVQHVGTNGVFKPEIKDFPGLSVKPKDDPTKTDVEVIKFLAHTGKLFAKEKFTHSYPFCWRCDTPLINYATSSWFVKVTALKDKLIKANQGVKWVPEDMKDGRFGKWLLGARDWAISRSRFWGAPLPVWRCETCKAIKVLGSIEELKNKIPRNNRYIVIRHGHAEHIVKNVLSAKISDGHHLTERGRGEAEASAKKLVSEKIDLIITSPLIRTTETAEIVRAKLGLDKKSVITDDRLREVGFGDLDMKSATEYAKFMHNSYEYGFHHRMPNGENLNDIKNRVGQLLYEVDKKYQGKNILFVTHETPAWLLISASLGFDEKSTIRSRSASKDYIATAEIKKMDFVPLPHNQNYEIDLHRPHIDQVNISCDCGGKLKRVPEVFDCWYESGSMPFASAHYPFEKKGFNPGGFLKRRKNFPANFIAEGQDQTRGWFYTMLILGVGLFDRAPYENVIVNGIVLAEDGQKMSKKLRNYPDPMEVVDKYGMDALRYYLLASPVVKAQDLCFSEKGVDDILKKVFNRLDNVLQFYLLYVSSLPTTHYSMPTSSNVLDQWILARLQETAETMTNAFESYELDKAVRPIGEFVEDLSTWYLRRSRNRFKSEIRNTKSETNPNVQNSNFKENDETDQQMALQTTKFVLAEFAKLIAPIAPFFAEYLYGNVKDSDGDSSVHLATWPSLPKVNGQMSNVLSEMIEVRKIVSLGLEARAKANIKVRQPLAKLTYDIHDSKIKDKPEMLSLVADEVNVKKVICGQTAEGEVELDVKITNELREEGNVRELMRAIQDLRKQKNLNPNDVKILTVSTDKVGQDLLKKYEKEITATTSTKLTFGQVAETLPEIKVEGLTFRIDI